MRLSAVMGLMRSGKLSSFRLGGLVMLGAAATLLSGCEEDRTSSAMRAYHPIPAKTLALMQEKGTAQNSPVLIRTYKKEAELEIWKMAADGHYVHLKTFPMCRWSGQLGPKVKEGDRQVPEGFYSITPGQMNPNSAYYLSFNVGYPNALDRALGHSGGSIMVHGVCSSAGCFSMTDQQIAEIYAIAREGFNGGQRAIQMQSYPFHMTAENMTKYRADQNIAFWKQLKEGADNFEVSKQEVSVGVCGKHYVFNESPTTAGTKLDAEAACPPLKHDDDSLQAQVEAKETADGGKMAELISQGVQPIRTVYADGGQNPAFAEHRGTMEMSRPEALAAGGQDYLIEEKKSGKKVPPAVALAAAKQEAKQRQAAEAQAAQPQTAQPQVAQATAPTQTAAAQPAATQPDGKPADGKPENVSSFAATPAPEKSEGSMFSRVWNWKSGSQPAQETQQAAVAPAEQPAAAPAAKPAASHKPGDKAAAEKTAHDKATNDKTPHDKTKPAAKPGQKPEDAAATAPVKSSQLSGTASPDVR